MSTESDKELLPKLTDQEETVLVELNYDAEYCRNYQHLEYRTDIKRKWLEPIIKRLKELEYIEFYRGLMTDEGEVAGSGWCRSKRGNDYVKEPPKENRMSEDNTKPEFFALWSLRDLQVECARLNQVLKESIEIMERTSNKDE